MKLIRFLILPILVSLIFSFNIPSARADTITCTVTADKTNPSPGDKIQLNVTFSNDNDHSFFVNFTGGSNINTRPEIRGKSGTYTVTAPSQYFAGISISPIPRADRDTYFCSTQAQSTIPPIGCTYDFAPKSISNETEITFTVSQTTKDNFYTANVGTNNESAKSDDPTTPLVIKVKTPDTKGSYNVGVRYQLPTGRGGGNCSAQSTTTISIGASGINKNPCAGGSCDTALGNISTNPAEFIKTILGIATGLAGGIALIFMVIGSIKVLTSSGDQQKLTGGRDMIVAAVSGLLFLILSVLILRFIGTSILGGIPGLS